MFVAPILDGTKIHTVREDKPGRWKPGLTMHMATGTRTKNYNCFKEEVCQATQRVFMTYDQGELEITVGTTHLWGYDERNDFAVNDGFKNWEDFEAWWVPILKKKPGMEYEGKCIHWTSHRY